VALKSFLIFMASSKEEVVLELDLIEEFSFSRGF
jgi:hypothetical protein